PVSPAELPTGGGAAPAALPLPGAAAPAIAFGCAAPAPPVVAAVPPGEVGVAPAGPAVLELPCPPPALIAITTAEPAMTTASARPASRPRRMPRVGEIAALSVAVCCATAATLGNARSETVLRESAVLPS